MTLEHLLNLQAYVINMPDKEEQYFASELELKKYGFKHTQRFVSFDSSDAEKLDGVASELEIKIFDGSSSQYSLALAHLSLLNKLVKSSELEEILIFEDDILFHPEFKVLAPSKLKNVQTYDMLYLGSWIVGNTTIETDTDTIVTDRGILQTHAYSINKKAAKFILDKVKNQRSFAIDQMYNNWYRNSGILLQAIIHSPYNSNIHTQVRTHRQEMTGLVYQKNHTSTVLKKA